MWGSQETWIPCSCVHFMWFQSKHCFYLYGTMPFPMEWRLPNIKIPVDFGAFHAISNKVVFSEFGLNPLWRCGNRKHEFCVVLDIPLNHHHECLSWIAPSTASPCSMGMEFYVQLWVVHAIPRNKIFFKLILTAHLWQWEIVSKGLLYICHGLKIWDMELTRWSMHSCRKTAGRDASKPAWLSCACAVFSHWKREADNHDVI